MTPLLAFALGLLTGALVCWLGLRWPRKRTRCGNEDELTLIVERAREGRHAR